MSIPGQRTSRSDGHGDAEERDRVGTDVTDVILAQLARLHEDAASIMTQAMADARGDIGRVLALDVDVRAWELAIEGQPSAQLLSDARKELAFATYSAAVGNYVQAYAGLRIFLELSVASVYFSVNELERRKWMNDRCDFSWRQALDDDTGLWSRDFVREFNEDCLLEAPGYAKRAREAYRRCSQFVHGKHKSRAGLPEPGSTDRIPLIVSS